MPISKKWSRMTTSNLEKVPEKRGVYELKSFGHDGPSYIGRSDNLRSRLKTHRAERDPNYFRYKVVGFWRNPSSLEEEHFEKYEARYGGLPPWNTQDPRKRGIF